MKAKLLLMTGLASVALVGAANAANSVFITGSTAYRNAINKTINAMFDASPAVQVAEYGNSTTYYKGTYLDFEGNIGGVAYIIKTHWSGSEAGVSDVATGASESFLDDIGSGSPAVVAGTFSGSPVAAQTFNSTVDIAMADNAQSFSKTKSPLLTGAFVGIIPFAWDKNAQTASDQTANPDWGRIVNVTDAQARVLLTGGSLAALITGNSADVTHVVYVAGRDDGSGTRVNTFGDTGFGIRTVPTQVLIGGSSGAPTITATGQGQSSGGTLAGTMDFTGSLSAADTINGGTGWIALAYLGLSDAETAETGGAVRLSFNGVTESTAAIQEGQYSFWGNEFIYQKPGIGANALTVYNKIVSGVNAQTDGTHEISTATMDCTRQGPLSDPVHN
jgi:hypothetical protein